MESMLLLLQNISLVWAFVVQSIPVTHVHWQTLFLSSNFSKFHFPSISVIKRVSDDLKMGHPAELAAKAITGDDDAKTNKLLGVIISNMATRAPLSFEQLQFTRERIPILAAKGPLGSASEG